MKDIIICKPDKGNGVVILNKTDYLDKINCILSDSTKFKKLDVDILDLCLKRGNKLIRFLRDKLLKNKSISQDTYSSIFTSGSNPGILYGLPKVHKDECPARPILSALGTYNYKLSKFLVPLLRPFTTNEFSDSDDELEEDFESTDDLFQTEGDNDWEINTKENNELYSFDY
eukprot:gene2790-3229_t